MDIGSIGGFVAGVVVVLWGIILGGVGFGAYWDGASVAIVLGGTFTAVFIAYPLSRVLGLGSVLSKVIKNPADDTKAIIAKILELANIARREGLLALEEAVSQVNDEFLKKGVNLIVDGTDPELVKSILETELSYVEGRHSVGKGLFDTIGALAPAFGMIGTLIGLVAMLQKLDDPSSIGPAMGTALLTTFYGSLVANMVCLPVSKKLEVRSGEEILTKEIMIEGLLSIQAGENPRIIEEKLKAFLPPKMRKTLSGDGEAEAEKGAA